MCVKIVKNNQIFDYDMKKPVTEQVKGSEEVIVNYLENDPSVHHFLDAIEEIAETTFGCGLNLRVIHNNTLNGARAKNKLVELNEKMTFNDIIRVMALIHYETDKKLSEIANICTGRNIDE